MRKTFTFEGKRYDVTAKTKTELNKKVAAKKKKLREQQGKVPKFDDWYVEFLQTYKSNLAFRTLESYKQRYQKHLHPYFRGRRLDTIRHSDCQKIFNGLRGYSQNYIHKLYHDLDQVFDKAIVNGYVEKNPVKGCILPSGSVTTRRAITAEERSAVLSVCEYHSAGQYVLFMLYCGLRPHEAAYIQGKDVNGDTLHVRGTKSACSDRYVPIPDCFLKTLPAIGENEYYIKSLGGAAPIRESHRRRMWNSFKRELGKYLTVADDLTPYCFRHTYCTDLQDAGIAINVAREFMGHSTINLTSRIYTHRSEVTFNNAKQQINSHIHSLSGKPV